MTTKPSNSNTMPVADYVAQQLTLCGKSQAQIAEECGFEKPNVITMIKQGKTKVPIKKIGAFAKALGIDPIFFLKMCLQEYSPSTLEAINMIIARPIVTQNEFEFIEVIRSAKVTNPRIRNNDQKKALLAIINGMNSDNAA